ncbi:uncharacterized protein G2W53_009146 [Senna tora]|uniref:Uncharacterized protein n=1 Tax=Senna tora TaxID=362788 RepID=A0A835CC18_9FABA|nr:uncharacterized protein G2W53_009146 [Senna tora]
MPLALAATVSNKDLVILDIKKRKCIPRYFSEEDANSIKFQFSTIDLKSSLQKNWRLIQARCARFKAKKSSNPKPRFKALSMSISGPNEEIAVGWSNIKVGRFESVPIRREAQNACKLEGKIDSRIQGLGGVQTWSGE